MIMILCYDRVKVHCDLIMNVISAILTDVRLIIIGTAGIIAVAGVCSLI